MGMKGTSTTKRRIAEVALDIFSQKGYDLTSIKDIARAVGIEGSSIYSHYSSKAEIFEEILDEFGKRLKASYHKSETLEAIARNPKLDVVVECFHTTFDPSDEIFCMKALSVAMLEQHRNPIARHFITHQFLLETEDFIKRVLHTLVELGVIRDGIDYDFWSKLHSSVLYTFTNRRILGIGDNVPGYEGNSTEDMIRLIYTQILNLYGSVREPVPAV